WITICDIRKEDVITGGMLRSKSVRKLRQCAIIVRVRNHAEQRPHVSVEFLDALGCLECGASSSHELRGMQSELDIASSIDPVAFDQSKHVLEVPPVRA